MTKAYSQISSKYPKLANWFKRYYGRSSPLWQQLSSGAKKSLSKWIGAVNYADFQKLVQSIILQIEAEYELRIHPLKVKMDVEMSKKRMTHPHMEWPNKYISKIKKLERVRDKSINQLKERQAFWSNYSDQFRRIRILLPENTSHMLKSKIETLEEVSFFQRSYELETEVCIFDFEAGYVAEFFRGEGSETRFYPKRSSLQLEAKLFQEEVNSPEFLRFLGGIFHDHVFLWQPACEQWLRSCSIFPNEDLKEFKSAKKFHSYDQERGLELPEDPEKIKDREKQREFAEEKMIELEKKAHRFFAHN